MDDADRKLFEQTLAGVVEIHSGAALDAALDELGWVDALADDARAAVSILFELQGTANATSGALGRVLTAALGVEASGIALPPLGRVDAPATTTGTGVTCRGLATASAPAADGVLVVAADDAGGWRAGTVRPADLTIRPVAGMDPALGLAEIRADLASGATDSWVEVDWPAALAAGQIALAHELLGASRTMLRLAREHALERVQFGRPIASFQALRHRLAESLVAVEAADAAVNAAWDDPSPLAATLAKAIAGQSARTVGRHAQQVLAGMGYTAEHAYHHYLRRTLLLDQLLGSGRTLMREFGEQLLSTRQLPVMLPL